MKILLLLILLTAIFCIPAQTADIMPGAGYKISALQVEQQSGSITLRGQMFQPGIIPEASLAFGKRDTDGFGLGLRIGGSQFSFSKSDERHYTGRIAKATGVADGNRPA